VVKEAVVLEEQRGEQEGEEEAKQEEQ